MNNAARLFGSLSLALVLTAGTAMAASNQPLKRVPVDAVIEKVDFEEVQLLDQALILGRIGIRPGDTLTTERVAQIPARLRTLAKPPAFGYKAGSKPGFVILSIRNAEGC